MQLKAKDLVKLLPCWPFGTSPEAPVWGSSEGYILGTVLKTCTGDHNPEKHCALVEWGYPSTKPDLPHGLIPESSLELADETDERIAEDFKSGVLLAQDIWVLIRTHGGKFALNVVEAYPHGTKQPNFIAGMTKQVLPTVEKSDYELVNAMLSNTDQLDVKVSTLWDAMNNIFRMWELPDFKSVNLPVRQYPSIREAAATCPTGNDAAVLFFHLKHNLVDFAADASPSD